MISPRAFRTAPSAKVAKFQFFAFALRHGFGVTLVAFLANSLRTIGEPLWWVTLAFGLLYATVAVYHGNKLYTLYRRRVAAEANGNTR